MSPSRFPVRYPSVKPLREKTARSVSASYASPAMARRQDVYNASTAYLRREERAGRVFILCPEAALDIGKTEHDPEKIQLAYDEGRLVGEKRLPALLEFLNH